MNEPGHRGTTTTNVKNGNITIFISKYHHKITAHAMSFLYA